MKNFKFLCLILLSTTLLMTGCDTTTATVSTGEKSADTALVNGSFYTVDEENMWAEAVAIDDGTIVYVGSMEGIDPYIGQQTEVIDLKGKFAMPSFVDSHMHPAANAYSTLFTADLSNAYTHEEYIAIITEFAEANPDLIGIMGSGFTRSLFDLDDQGVPDPGSWKASLDAIDSTRPVGIVDMDIHSMWVNSKTLEILDITKDTPDPPGGVFQRDPDTGEPTGLLVDYAAYDLAWALMPLPTLEEYKTALLWLQDWLNAEGITTVHDAWGEMAWEGEEPVYYEAYNQLAEEGKLTVRYRASTYIDPEYYSWDIPDAIDQVQQYNHPHFKVHSFKFLTDGSLEEETALLVDPYENIPPGDYYGLEIWSDNALADAFTMVDRAGYQIHVHVIGDGATRDTVNALEKAVQKNGARDSRHSLAHVQMARPEDVKKMGDLGLSAHMSQSWFGIDEGFWDSYLPCLGNDRAFNQMYPHKSLIDAGVNVTVSSDWPTSEPDVMHSIYSGMTRIMPFRLFQDWYGNNPDYRYVTDPDVELRENDISYLPPASERVSLEEMIRAATINGAYANFLEDEIGSIEVGKKADIVVLSMNLFSIDTEEIPNVQIEMTFFEGELVYEMVH